MNEEQNINQLPKGWKWVKLGDIAKKKSVKVLPNEYPLAKFIGMDCIQPHTLKPFFLYDFKEFKSAGNYFNKGQVLYGRMRPYLNKVYRSEFDGVCSGEFIILDCGEIFNPDLLKYILHSKDFVRFANDITTGDRPRITYEEISNYKIALSPIKTQQAIVSKIEELFSELDKGIENLHTAQQQLKTYRQAVLKWAFEGKLTNENVKEGELPEGWKWVKISDLCKVVRGGSPRPAGDPKYYDGNIPFLKVADLTKDEGMFLTTYKYTIKEAGLHKTRQIKPNTLLLSNSGATLGVPKICMIDATMNDGIAAFLDLDERSNQYLYYFWLSKTRELRNINMGAAQPNLNTDIIKDYNIPYCSIEEQHNIVQAIESRLSVADKTEETISQSLQQAEALRQSILKKAFEGRLV